MTKMPLSVKNQSIETSGLTKDYREALCEYIWNGFEAGATEVTISYSLNELEGVQDITISDNGSGINYYELSDTFGSFLVSQKNSLSLKEKAKANKRQIVRRHSCYVIKYNLCSSESFIRIF